MRMETPLKIPAPGNLISSLVSRKLIASVKLFILMIKFREDMYAPDSIELLQKSGLDFQRHDEMGIDPDEFATLLITSGLVLTDEAKWIGFHRHVFPTFKP